MGQLGSPVLGHSEGLASYRAEEATGCVGQQPRRGAGTETDLGIFSMLGNRAALWSQGMGTSGTV